MLDNFGPEKGKAAAKELKAKYPHALFELSGGVTLVLPSLLSSFRSATEMLIYY